MPISNEENCGQERSFSQVLESQLAIKRAYFFIIFYLSSCIQGATVKSSRREKLSYKEGKKRDFLWGMTLYYIQFEGNDNGS